MGDLKWNTYRKINLMKRLIFAVSLLLSLALGAAPALGGTPSDMKEEAVSSAQHAIITDVQTRQRLAGAPSIGMSLAAAVELQAIPAIGAIIKAILKAIANGAKKAPKSTVSKATKKYSKSSVNKALKEDLLSQNTNRWNHIFATKHKWKKVGAQGNRSKAADRLAKTVTNGKVVKIQKGSIIYRWVYKGQQIEATVSRATGKISNGWVK